MVEDPGVVVEEAGEALSLEPRVESLFERALETGDPQDVKLAVDALYRAAEEAAAERKDKVVLAFLFEIARRVLKLEDRIERPVPPPTA